MNNTPPEVLEVDRKQRLEQLRQKFLSMLSDAELYRQCAKCPNKWVWSSVELEAARRQAKADAEYFN